MVSSGAPSTINPNGFYGANGKRRARESALAAAPEKYASYTNYGALSKFDTSIAGGAAVDIANRK